MTSESRRLSGPRHPSGPGTAAPLEGPGQPVKHPDGNTFPPEPSGTNAAAPRPPCGAAAPSARVRAVPPSRGAHALPSAPVAGSAPGPSSPPGDGPGSDPGGALRSSAGAPPAQGRTWEIEFPPGLPVASANDRGHWAARHRKTQALKDAAIVMTRKAKIPPLGRIRVTVLYDPPDRRHRDHDNLSPTAKHLTDGIVKAGVIANDTPEYVVPGRCEVTETVVPRGRLRMVVEEVTP